MKRTTKSIQAEIAKGAFRPHTALFDNGAGLLSAGNNIFCKEYVSCLPGAAVL